LENFFQEEDLEEESIKHRITGKEMKTMKTWTKIWPMQKQWSKDGRKKKKIQRCLLSPHNSTWTKGFNHEKNYSGIWTQGEKTHALTNRPLCFWSFRIMTKWKSKNEEFEIVPDLKAHIISFETIEKKSKKKGDDVRWGSAKPSL